MRGGFLMHTDLDEQYDKIYRYCYMKLRHQQTAEDITQETFLRFLENKTYKDMGKEISYLYRIARNLCIDQIRKQKNEALSEELSGCMENIQERMAVHMDLRKAIKSLDAQEQELVFLRYVNELSVGKTAEILGISRFALYRKDRECLKKLKKEMLPVKFTELIYLLLNSPHRDIVLSFLSEATGNMPEKR